MWGVNNRMFEKWIVLIFLFVGMLWDIKKKTVPKIYLVVWAIGAITYLISEIAGEKSIFSIFWALIPGFVVLLISLITGEKIGLGDGLILLCVGCFQGVKDVLCMLFFSFVILTVFLILFLVMRRVGRTSRVPFVPFMFMGQLMVMFGGVL